jgi:hypothetical protein
MASDKRPTYVVVEKLQLKKIFLSFPVSLAENYIPQNVLETFITGPNPTTWNYNVTGSLGRFENYFF